MASQHFPCPCLRPKEAAAYIGCGLSTLWRWARLGIVPPPQKIGLKYTYWLREDLEQFLGIKKEEVK